MRADGSTFHVVDYNETTGAVKTRCTAQGLRDNSTWSRGQAWCIYGFTMAHRYTRQPLHIETARRCANFFLDQTASQGEPRDGVPLWDFSFGAGQTVDFRDASAVRRAAGLEPACPRRTLARVWGAPPAGGAVPFSSRPDRFSACQT